MCHAIVRMAPVPGVPVRPEESGSASPVVNSEAGDHLGGGTSHCQDMCAVNVARYDLACVAGQTEVCAGTGISPGILFRMSSQPGDRQPRGSGEMVDAHALGACAERREGSNPSSPTIFTFNITSSKAPPAA
jgi:hypothetical protein